MTKEKIFPQIAYVEQPFGQDPPNIHCPLCGQMSIGENRPDEERCEHTVFIHTDLVDDYEYISVDFSARLEALEERLGENGKDLSDLDCFNELLPKLGYGKELLVFQVTHGGMAMGPVWTTDTFACDLGVKENNNK